MSEINNICVYIIKQLKNKLFYLNVFFSSHFEIPQDGMIFYYNMHTVNHILCELTYVDGSFKFSRCQHLTHAIYDIHNVDVDTMVNDIYHYIINETDYKHIIEMENKTCKKKK